jgi:hypothetical protein
LCVGWGREGLRQAGIGDGRLSREMERDYAGPDGERIIGIVVDRRAGANFCGHFFEIERENGGAFQLGGGGFANVVPAAGNDVIRDRAQSDDFFVVRGDGARGAENNCAAIVHRMMEGGTRENKSIEERDRDADRHTFGEFAQHAAGSGAVDVERVALAAVAGGDHIGLAIESETDVANEGFVENFEDDIAIVGSALGQALHLRARCGRELRHTATLRFAQARRKGHSG